MKSPEWWMRAWDPAWSDEHGPTVVTKERIAEVQSDARADLLAENAALKAENERLRKAVEFYADPGQYHAIAFVFDSPCGGFADDFTEDLEYRRPMPGKTAREALKGEV